MSTDNLITDKMRVSARFRGINLRTWAVPIRTWYADPTESIEQYEDWFQVCRKGTVGLICEDFWVGFSLYGIVVLDMPDYWKILLFDFRGFYE